MACASASTPTFAVRPAVTESSHLRADAVLTQTDDGLHVKELAIVKPPFTLITFFLTSNLNSAALGIEALFAKTPEQRQAAPQSGEVAGILIRDLRQDDAKGYLDRLSRYWVESGKRKELIWNVPALHEVFGACSLRHRC